MDFARLLVEHGADVNSQDDYKSTPLHLASRGGHVEIARVLLGRGTNVIAENSFRSTPLHLALDGGHVEFAQMLIEHGADVNAQDSQVDAGASSVRRRTRRSGSGAP